MFFKSRKSKKQKDLEEDLLEFYSKMWSMLPTGLDKTQGREQFRKLIEICKQQAKAQGTDNLPADLGDIIISLYRAGDPKRQKMVNRALDDGATIEDFREFWNLPDLSRRMVQMSEEVFRYAQFTSFTERGLTADQAMLEVKKMFPMYGDPTDTSKFSADDRPLTQELRGRVDIYRERHGAAAISEKVKQFSSYNALVRDEIRKGNL